MPLSVTTALLDLVDVILRGVREVCVLEGLIARQVEDEAVRLIECRRTVHHVDVKTCPPNVRAALMKWKCQPGVLTPSMNDGK